MSDWFATPRFSLESFGPTPSGALRAKKSNWQDPGVARETRLPQATLGNAFSVKMQAGCPRSQRYARAIGVKMRARRPRSQYEVVVLRKTKTDIEMKSSCSRKMKTDIEATRLESLSYYVKMRSMRTALNR